MQANEALLLSHLALEVSFVGRSQLLLDIMVRNLGSHGRLGEGVAGFSL